MIRTNKFVLFGALAAAVLVLPAVLGPLGVHEAQAARDQSNNAIQRAAGVVAANVNAQANVDVSNNDVTVCIVADQCE